MHGAASDNLSHSFLSDGGKLEVGRLSVVVTNCAVATTVAIETTGSVRRDQLRLREIQLTKNVTLLS